MIMTCRTHGDIHKLIQSLVGKPERNRSLGRPRRRREENIQMDLREVYRDAGDWIELSQDRVQWRAYVRAVMTPGSLKAN